MYKADNAVILAAGVSSRFAPLSIERPKALTEVRGEVLIERQIQQLHQAGVSEVYVVVGYMAEHFMYLVQKYGVHIIENREYLTRNNHSSIFAARHVIRNTYICSADNYFQNNPFETEISESYYAAVYADGSTKEWCMHTNEAGIIDGVQVGGSNAWYMLGHAFWSEAFSTAFLDILNDVYDKPGTEGLFWEDIYIRNLDVLKMKIRKYPNDFIFEFDSLDELREFDDSYFDNTRSQILKQIAASLNCAEREITGITPCKTSNTAVTGIFFSIHADRYQYLYGEDIIRRCLDDAERYGQ